MTIAAPFAVGVSPAAAAELPSGAELQVRLLAPVSSRHSRPGHGGRGGADRRPAPPRLRPSKVEVLLLLAAHAHPVVLGLAEAGKLARRQAGPPAIAYGAGVEMTLRLLEAVRLPAEAAVAPAVGEDLAADVDLVRLASAPPFRAVAARLRAPCDLINIMFVGSGADLHAGFVQAGWSSAAAGARPTS